MIQTSASEDEEAGERPAAEWVFIGSALVLALFFPLSALGLWLGTLSSNLSDSSRGAASMLRAAPIFLAFASSAAASGALLGRFALRASHRSVLLSGALGGAWIVLIASLGGALQPAAVAVAASVLLIGGGALCARVGSRFGRRRRPK